MPRPAWEGEFRQQQLAGGYTDEQAGLLQVERLRRKGANTGDRALPG